MRFGFVKSLLQKVDTLITGRGRIDEDLFEDIEATLIQADVNIHTATGILDELRRRVAAERLSDPVQITAHLRDAVRVAFEKTGSTGGRLATSAEPPTLYLFVGVNGSGKTTTIAKLAHRLTSQGNKVVMAAADTFRAAAIDQLQTWAERTGSDIVRHRPGADPSAVVYDAIRAARARGAGFVLADTAGRIQTKSHLMEELRKVTRVVERELGRPADETLLVLDATTGQNGVSQAKLFAECAKVTGIVLAKLDGTARGGIVVTIADELGLPIKLVGSGERVGDLEDFDAEAFVEALLA